MAIIEMQYNGNSNLVIGHRTVRPGSTFFIDEKEIADYINPIMINTGVITYVNNNGLPAGTISASLVMMQQQTAISATDVQTAMDQISTFMADASGTFSSLNFNVSVLQQQSQLDQQNITELETDVSDLESEYSSLSNNVNNIATNVASMNTTLTTQGNELTALTTQVNNKPNLALASGITFPSGISSVTVHHGLNTMSYYAYITPTSDPGSATFWVQKGVNDIVVNANNLSPSSQLAADIFITN